MTNARDPSDGLVHSCELVPQYDKNRVSKAGFTWCMHLFTWIGEGRFHPPEDGSEFRYVRTDEPTTCFKCIAAECGSDPYVIL